MRTPSASRRRFRGVLLHHSPKQLLTSLPLCLSISLWLQHLRNSEHRLKQLVSYLLTNQKPYRCFLPCPFLPQQLDQGSSCSHAATVCLCVLSQTFPLWSWSWRTPLSFPISPRPRCSPQTAVASICNVNIVESSCRFFVLSQMSYIWDRTLAFDSAWACYSLRL